MSTWNPTDGNLADAFILLKLQGINLTFDEVREWADALPEIASKAPAFRWEPDPSVLTLVVSTIVSAHPDWSPSDAVSADDAHISELFGDDSLEVDDSPFMAGDPLLEPSIDISLELFTLMLGTLAQLPYLLRGGADVCDDGPVEMYAAGNTKHGSLLAVALMNNWDRIPQTTAGKVTLPRKLVAHVLEAFNPYSGLAEFVGLTLYMRVEGDPREPFSTQHVWGNHLDKIFNLASEEGLIVGGENEDEPESTWQVCFIVD